MTKLCAEAMGFERVVHELSNIVADYKRYDPLHDDAQAMALVKKLRLSIVATSDGLWIAGPQGIDRTDFDIENVDLNRAIVECVAKIQANKS